MANRDLLWVMNLALDALQQSHYAVLSSGRPTDWEFLLEQLRHVNANVERATLLAVGEARDNEYSWAEIGAALLIHESTARLRYKGRLEIIRVTAAKS